MALLLKREAKHFLTDSNNSFSPLTFKKVSCCPANDALGKSSAIALDLTAISILSFLYKRHNSL